jgi:hypothetical protein
MAQKSKAAEIVLSRVVLYKHGTGYFERRGQVTGGTSLALTCASDGIEDMLKSLVIIDPSETTGNSVTYDCATPAETRLQLFGVNLRAAKGFLDVISQAKGSPITVMASGETVAGRVVGFDAVTSKGADGVSWEEKLLVIYTGENTFRRIAMSSISSIKIEEPTFAAELQEQLETLFESAKRAGVKSLNVGFGGKSTREVMVAYSVPAPIWKTSYRLVLNDDDKLLLQGMALVDNTSTEDWKNVQLVLVSSAPVSFIQPLYEPIVPERRTVDRQGSRAVKPLYSEQGIKTELDQLAAGFNKMGFGSAPAAPGAVASARAESVGMGSLNFEESDDLNIEAAEVGNLFEYRIESPVTVPAQTSAMIPIVYQPVEGERISLFNRSASPDFPYAAIRFKNTTELTLEAGPVTVFEQESYAGEALMDVVKPKNSCYLPFALDLGCRVIVRTDYQQRPIWRVRVWSGILYLDYRENHGLIYEIENVTDREKTVIVEHPIHAGAGLISPENAMEVTESYYRFKVVVPAREHVQLPVWEQTDTFWQVRIEDVDAFDAQRVEWLLAQNILDEKFAELLKNLADKRRNVRSLAEQRKRLAADIERLEKDQERARENLKTLGSSNEKYRRLLDEAEDNIASTTREMQELDKQIDAAKQEYSDLARTELLQEIQSK